MPRDKGRNPNRISGVLDAVRVAWEQCPDLRLGQLLENAASYAGHSDAFYVEDEELTEALRDMEMPDEEF